MLIKSWKLKSKYFDSQFDRVANTIWYIWCDERMNQAKDVLDAEKWEERFHCKPLISKSEKNTWDGLIFNDEAHYMLFLLEWA
jgi:hypothetical protein